MASYIILSTQIRFDCGPTFCGDKDQDPVLMSVIGAELTQEPGQSVEHYMSPHPPRVVLNKLDDSGYEVVCSSGCGQTNIWTLKKRR